MKKILLLLFFLALANTATAADYQLIHEAFIEPVRDLTPQEIISESPPESKAEIPPKQPNAQTVWIPGYWAWEKQTHEFVWVCGVWRLPPPNHSWLTGHWLKKNIGWIWVRGAWLETKNHTLSNLISSKVPPPALRNEDTGTPPAAEFFWCMGYWQLNKVTETYEWLNGSWHNFDPEWIFVAAHWIWRPEGYLFIPAYWDWRLEERGESYDCADQSPLTSKDIAQVIVLSYPDYTAECCFYQYYQPLFWSDCDCLPPWWSWNDWWSIPWNESWWLWWWYSHDGYPCPPFILSVVELLPPPSAALNARLGQLPAPIFITPFGVPSLDLWIKAMNTVLGGSTAANPLLPESDAAAIIENLGKLMPKSVNVRPTGESNRRLKKPFDPNLSTSSNKAIIPLTPEQLAAAKKASQARQTFNIPPIEFVNEPVYNPILKSYPTPVITPQDYRRGEYFPWFQNYDNEGRRRGAHHEHHEHHEGGGGGGGKKH